MLLQAVDSFRLKGCPQVRSGAAGCGPESPETAMSPYLRPLRPALNPLSERFEMAVKIRLRREGRKKTPMYRIVVADSKAPRDGRFIEIIGQYQPRGGENAINLKIDRVEHWLNVGALPTDTVRSLLRRAGILKARHEARLASKLQASAVAMPSGEA
jgi:small subunit ribosomal protein S16